MIPGNAELIREMQAELFRKKGHGWYRVVSGSMRPLVDVGDRVLAQVVSPSKLQAGDIIIFKQESVFVTHRVIKSLNSGGKDLILQKGDAGFQATAIEPKTVLGKVSTIDRHGKLLDLTRGRGRILNQLLVLKNCKGYELSAAINAFKKKLQTAAAYGKLRIGYRVIKNIFFEIPFRAFLKAMWK